MGGGDPALPGRREFALELLDRRTAKSLLHPAHGRPCIRIADQVGGPPLHFDGKRRRRQFLKREIEGAIALLHMATLRRPVRANDILVEMLDDRIDFRIRLHHAIGDESQDRSWPADTARVLVESGKIEPVRCLGRRHEVHGSIRNSTALCRRDPVFDSPMHCGLLDLLRTTIGGDDMIEALSQQH